MQHPEMFKDRQREYYENDKISNCHAEQTCYELVRSHKLPVFFIYLFIHLCF